MEKIADELLRDYQRDLAQRKQLIIDQLKSSESDLLTKIRQNPKLWNSACLHIELTKSLVERFIGRNKAKYRSMVYSSICIKKPEVTPKSSD